jgi:hypothetical protein
MAQHKLDYMFQGVCAESGSSMHPNDYKRLPESTTKRPPTDGKWGALPG